MSEPRSPAQRPDPAATEPAAAGSPQKRGAERRLEPRRSVGKMVQLRLVDNAASAKTLIARLFDLSASGVGLRLERPIAPGTYFILTAQGANGVTTAVLYRVVRCRPLGGSKFDVGAAFVRTPETDVAPTVDGLCAAVRRLHEASTSC